MNNNEQAVSEIVACWEGLVPFILNQATSKRDLARLEKTAPDIAQQTVTETLLRLHNGRPIPNVQEHMYSHALDIIQRRERIRSQNERRSRELHEEFERRVAASSVNSFMAEIAANVLTDVRFMGDAYFAVFLRHYSHEHEPERIAKDMQMPLAEVENRIELLERRFAAHFLQRPRTDTSDAHYKMRRDCWANLDTPAVTTM